MGEFTLQSIAEDKYMADFTKQSSYTYTDGTGTKQYYEVSNGLVFTPAATYGTLAKQIGDGTASQQIEFNQIIPISYTLIPSGTPSYTAVAALVITDTMLTDPNIILVGTPTVTVGTGAAQNVSPVNGVFTLSTLAAAATSTDTITVSYNIAVPATPTIPVTQPITYTFTVDTSTVAELTLSVAGSATFEAQTIVIDTTLSDTRVGGVIPVVMIGSTASFTLLINSTATAAGTELSAQILQNQVVFNGLPQFNLTNLLEDGAASTNFTLNANTIAATANVPITVGGTTPTTITLTFTGTYTGMPA